LAGTDSGVATRTWQQALDAIIETKNGSTQDAESEMSAGKGSRLSQLLLYHPKLSGQDKPSDLPVPVAGEPPNPSGLRIRSFQLDPIHGVGGDEAETDKRNDESNSHASEVHNAAHEWCYNRPTHDGHDQY
jgi:hypothetical protein